MKSKLYKISGLIFFLGFFLFSGNVNAQDSDGDGIANTVDLDDDNDGILDTAEGLNCSGVLMGSIYANTDSGKIVSVNLDTNVSTVICSTASVGGDIAVQGNYAYYPVFSAGSGTIKKVQLTAPFTETTVTTAVPVGAGGFINALSSLPDGSLLVGLSLSGSVYKISNPSSATPTVSLWATIPNFWSGGDFVFMDNVIYGLSTQASGSSTYKLVKIAVNAAYNYVSSSDIGNLTGSEAYGLTKTSSCDLVYGGNSTIYKINDVSTNGVSQITLLGSSSGGNGAIYGVASSNEISATCSPACTSIDTDGDGIPNQLDLDSDNDGCVDAIEGGAAISPSQLVTAGGALTVGTGSTASKQNLCSGSSCVDANGVPTIVGASGQSAGDAYNNAVNACLDSDNDGIPNSDDLDDDNDGILDTNEGLVCNGSLLGTVYVNTSTKKIVSINLDTNVSTVLCTTVDQGGDIAVQGNFAYYAVLAGGVGTINKVDLTTCAETIVTSAIPVGASSTMNALSFLPDGSLLVGITQSGDVYKISNPSSATPTVSPWATIPNYFSGGDFVFMDSVVYGLSTQTSGGTSYKLVKIIVHANYNFVSSSDIGNLPGTDGYCLTKTASCDLVYGGNNSFYKINDVSTNGVSQVTLLGSGYGTNGLIYGVASYNENNASCSPVCTTVDTDGDGTPDYLDLDSDNDGGSDANEAYGVSTAQGTDGNMYYGNGNPPSVNANGTVTAATYPGTNANVVIAGTAGITTNPSNQSVVAGSNTTFTVATTSTSSTTFAAGVPDYTIPPATNTFSSLIYQWQYNTGSGFVNVPNTAPYSGVNSATLTITGATMAMNGYTYRVIVTNPDNIYSAVTSTSAILNTLAPVDSDGDGIIDSTDLDDDNDGILDAVEAFCDQPLVANSNSGTGIYQDQLYFFNWDGSAFTDGIQNGDSQTFTLGDLSVTATFSNVVGNGSGYVPSDMNTYSAATLWQSYNTPGTKEAFYGSSNADVTFTVNFTATKFGIPFPLVLLALDAEQSAQGPPDEYIRFITNGEPWTALETMNLGGTFVGAGTNNLLCDTTNGSNTIFDSFNATKLDITIEAGGRQAIAFGLRLLCDADNDGIPNYLDLDSDNDGCVDALEGGSALASSNLVTAGGTVTVGAGSLASNQNLCATAYTGTATDCVGSTGIPLVVNQTSGQTVGSAINSLIKAAACSVCYELPTDLTTSVPVNHGITLIGRAGSDNGNWPMLRNSAYTALESKTKGFVITRNANPEGTILAPVVGMMVFDTDATGINGATGCLKIYTGSAVGEGWKCFNTQTCP